MLDKSRVERSGSRHRPARIYRHEFSQHTVIVIVERQPLKKTAEGHAMGRDKLQHGIAGMSWLLLHLVASLVLWQIVLWVTGRQSLVIPSRDSTISGTNEYASGRALLPLRLPSRDRATQFLVNDQRRYYDPGLAMAAENLDAQARYYAAMALEECYALSHDGLSRFRDDFLRRLTSGNGPADGNGNWAREYAFKRSNRDCVVFDGSPISPGYVLGLIQSAARDGDPRAIARTLLFRDLADSKVGNYDLVARLLSTGDPNVIRDVGLFLTRGESTSMLGDAVMTVRATTLAVAWELVACDFGLDCGSDSKLLNNLCAYQGQCDAFSYEDWISLYSGSGEELSEILRARLLLRRGLMMQDWHLLGLSVLKRQADR